MKSRGKDAGPAAAAGGSGTTGATVGIGSIDPVVGGSTVLLAPLRASGSPRRALINQLLICRIIISHKYSN